MTIPWFSKKGRMEKPEIIEAPTAPPASAPQSKADMGLELVKEAEKWLHVREKGGANKGPEVERFQKAVDDRAMGEAWCMSFVQFCVKEVGKRFGYADKLFDSEHCLTVWNKTDKACRVPLEQVQPGDIVIWRHGQTMSGHTGFVESVVRSNNGSIAAIKTIEGNTSDASFRDGDGVYRRQRGPVKNGSMVIVGFLRVF